MSETTATIDPSYIPDDSQVATPTGRRQLWRFADGKLCTGRESEGTYQTREKIVGRLRRIGVYFGTLQDRTPYGQIEIDIETSDGMTRVKASVTDQAGNVKPSVAAVSFAEGLLDLAKDEPIIVTAGQSTKPNKYGKLSTYANLFHLNLSTMRGVPTSRLPIDKTKTLDDKWESLWESLKTHPAYAERPASESDSEDGTPNTHLSALCKEMIARGWPTPEQAPAEWLKLMQVVSKEASPRASLADWPDDTWGELRLALQKREGIPAILKPAQERLAKTAPPNPPATNGKVDLSALEEEYDPFAE